jgi:hypothetical protein
MMIPGRTRPDWVVRGEEAPGVGGYHITRLEHRLATVASLLILGLLLQIMPPPTAGGTSHGLGRELTSLFSSRAEAAGRRPTMTATPPLPSANGHGKPALPPGRTSPGVNPLTGGVTYTLMFQQSADPYGGCSPGCYSTAHYWINGVDLGSYDSALNTGNGFVWTNISIDVTTAIAASTGQQHVYWKWDHYGGVSAAHLRNMRIVDSSGNIFYDQYYPTFYNGGEVGGSGDPNCCPSTQIDLTTGTEHHTADGYVDHYISTGPASPASAGFGSGNAGKPNTIECTAGDPVNCANGNFFEEITDVQVPGRGRSLSFTRTYNVLAAAAATTTVAGGVGWGWTSSYAMSLSFPTTNTVMVSQENGATVGFTQSGSTYLPGPGVLASRNHSACVVYSHAR